MTSDNCPFCKIDAGRVFHAGDRILGICDAFPVSHGHALLVPRRHVASWFEATAEERIELGEATTIARQAIIARNIRKEHPAPDGFNVGINIGESAGQTVFHLHVHVIPRYRGDVPDPRGGVRHIIPSRATYPVASAVRDVVADTVAAYRVREPARLLHAADEIPDRSVVAFGERMLQLLDQSRRVATYKYAVLLALTDLCLEQASASGEPPAALTAHDLAEKVLELYWPHTAAFDGKGGLTVLRQNTGGQAEILSAITKFRDQHAADPSEPLSRARHRTPQQYERLVRTVEWKLVEMPLPRLQRLGNVDSQFLYRISWNDKTVTRRDMESSNFDSHIYLKPGVGTNLIRLSGLLRPLIQRGWSSMVAQLNPAATDEARLQEFLFGAVRIPLEPVRGDLRELQNNRCFYCDEGLERAADVDHFLPWARHPDNGIENLVVAHPSCNGNKSDFLAAGDHVRRWSDRFADSETIASQLAQIAVRAEWERHPVRTINVARSIYRSLPADVQLWVRKKEFVAFLGQRNVIECALAICEG